MIFKFNTKNAFIKSEATPTIVIDKIDEIRKKALTDRFKYYDLPQKWESKNWKVKVDFVEDVFKNLVNKETSHSKPMIINLDSVVLTDDDLDCESWDEDDRFTIFNIKIITQ